MPSSRSMTGLSRSSIAMVSVPIVAASVAMTLVLCGSAGWCGFDENQAASGYCSAGPATRLLLVGLPSATVLAGFLLTLWRGRMTFVLLAAVIALGEGIVELGFGW